MSPKWPGRSRWWLPSLYWCQCRQMCRSTENDATGQVTVNGTSNTMTGFVDTNLGFSPLPDTQINGAFITVPSDGRSTGSLANTFFPTTPPSNANTIPVAFYLVDSAHVFFIETDSLSSGLLSFGYLAPRIPVCRGCQ